MHLIKFKPIWMLFILMSLIAACQGKKKHVAIGTGGDRVVRDGISHQGYPLEQSLGLISHDGESYSEFQNTVADFVSATMDPYALGEVSPYENDSTGMRFWGEIHLEQGPYYNGMPYTRVIPGSTWLRIAIWDSFSGTVDANGQEIPEIPIYFPRAVEGYIDYESAEIIFEDEYGQVALVGSIYGETFEGQLYFRNYRSFDGAQPASGTMSFVIDTQSFFR